MKDSKQCPKCNGLRIGYLENLPDENAAGTASTQAIGTSDVLEGSSLFGRYVHSRHDIEAYLCTDCGFLESYVKSPKTIPYESLKGFRWANPQSPPEGAYR